MHCQIRKIEGLSEVKSKVRGEMEKKVKIKVIKKTTQRFAVASESK